MRTWLQHSETRSIASNTVWLIADRSLRMVLALVTTVWIARHLGVERFGTYNYVLALVLLFGEITTLGLNSLLVREIVRDADRRRLTIGTALTLRVLSGLASVGASYLLVRALRPGEAEIHALVVVLSLGVLFRALEVLDHDFQSRVEARYPALSRMVAGVVIAVSTIAMLIVEAELATFIFLRAAEFVTVGGILFLLYRHRQGDVGRWRFDPEVGRGLLSKSWPLILSGLGAVIYLKIDQIMLGQFRGDREVGLYAVAAQLSEVWYFFPVALANSVFPSLVRLRSSDPEAYRRRFRTLYRLLVLGALAVAIPTALLARPIVTLLYGESFSAAGTILAIHIWASIFIFMRAALSKWLIAEGLFVFSIVTHGAGAVVNVLLNLLLIPSLGAIGAAVATVISYIVASYLALFVHPATRPAAYAMSRALLTPFHGLGKLARRPSGRSES